MNRKGEVMNECCDIRCGTIVDGLHVLCPVCHEMYQVLSRKNNARLDKLTTLESAGVDNWEGYDDAMNMMEG